jgi:hypothetical protein
VTEALARRTRPALELPFELGTKRAMAIAPLRLVASFGLFALLALGACKADSGDACKEENDCSGNLVCCKAGSASSTARGVCLPSCEVPDSGVVDSGASDSGTTDAGVDSGTEEQDAGEDASTEDAGAEDAGAEDAGVDAGEEDAGVDAGEDAGLPA